MPGTLQPHSSFEDSAVQAQYRVLLALADGLRHVLSQAGTTRTLEAANLSVNELVTHVGLVAAQHIQDGVENAAEIEGIWNSCLAYPKISQASAACGKLLEAARTQSRVRLKSPAPFSELEARNHAAFQFIEEILSTHGLGRLMPAEPAVLELFYDGDAKHFCAGSSRIAKRIRWAYQPVAHAVKAILLSELILAHEYLSHIVPLNSHLDQSVREGWLGAALLETMHVTPAIETWKRLLWADYREDLYRRLLKIWEARPIAATSVRFEGLQGVEDQAIRLHSRSRAQFWRLTGLLLEQGDSAEAAADITSMMDQMVNLAERAIGLLVEHKSMTIVGLLDNLDA
jgi:hypothetical protein